MPICLSCGYNICLYYSNEDNLSYIEECWCGGYVIDRDLISEIIRKEESLRRTLHLFKLDDRLEKDKENQMINYAIVNSLLEDINLRRFIEEKKNRNTMEYLMEIVEYVLERKI